VNPEKSGTASDSPLHSDSALAICSLKQRITAPVVKILLRDGPRVTDVQIDTTMAG
jgi:hypothetical protein